MRGREERRRREAARRGAPRAALHAALTFKSPVRVTSSSSSSGSLGASEAPQPHSGLRCAGLVRERGCCCFSAACTATERVRPPTAAGCLHAVARASAGAAAAAAASLFCLQPRPNLLASLAQLRCLLYTMPQFTARMPSDITCLFTCVPCRPHGRRSSPDAPPAQPTPHRAAAGSPGCCASGSGRRPSRMRPAGGGRVRAASAGDGRLE